MCTSEASTIPHIGFFNFQKTDFRSDFDTKHWATHLNIGSEAWLHQDPSQL